MNAEKALIGLIITRKELPKDFSPNIFIVFKKIADELQKGEFEFLTLADKFGASLIAECLEESIELTSLEAGIGFLKKQMARLQIQNLAKRMSEDVKTQDPEQMLEYITKNIEELGKYSKKPIEFITYTNVLSEAFDELMNITPEEVISFGYEFLDNKLTGIFPSELVVIGGETGTGKTTFATNIIYKASKKYKCTVLALEDRLTDYGIKATYFEIGRLRKIKGKSNYPWNDYRRGALNTKKYFLDDFNVAQDNLRNENIEFVRTETQMNIETLEQLIKERVKNGTKLFLIDHLHYFDLSAGGKENKADYIEKLMVRLKTVQNNTGARVILIVHYKKLDGKKPTLDSFKDSIAIVQNASYVISLWRDRENEINKNNTVFFLPKSRNPNGEGVITVNFNPETNDYVAEEPWRREEIINNTIL